MLLLTKPSINSISGLKLGREDPNNQILNFKTFDLKIFYYANIHFHKWIRLQAMPV